MSAAQNPGRVAGLWYLLLVLLGPLRLIYIPSKLFVHDNAEVTISNILAHEQLFRLGMTGDLLGGVVLVLLGLAFYRLFKGVDKNLAVLVVIFGGVMPALLYFVGVACDSGTLLVARDTSYLTVFDKSQKDALAMLILGLHSQLITAAETLWGVWLFPLAVLVYRSRFLPRFLGVWLFINGLAYVTLSLTGELLPQYQGDVYTYGQPAFLAEMVLMLWLVIKGAKPNGLDGLKASSPLDAQSYSD